MTEPQPIKPEVTPPPIIPEREKRKEYWTAQTQPVVSEPAKPVKTDWIRKFQYGVSAYGITQIWDAAKTLIGQDEATEQAREEADISVDNVDKARWFVNFYNRIPVLMASGEISSYDEYVDLLGGPDVELTPDELDEAVSAFDTDVAIPDWLEIEPEKDIAIDKFFGPTQLAPPESIQRLTVDAILNTLTKPRVTLPEDMTEEEFLRYVAIKDLPPESVNSVFDVTQAVKVWSEADAEQRQLIANVKAGIAEWETPNMSFWERTFFIAQSPMQGFADFLQPYIEHIGHPVAGIASLTVAELWPGTQGVEELYDNARARGVDPWHAAGQSFEEWDLAWYYKLPIEILADPITYVPGIGLSVPGKVLTKVGLRTFGGKLISLNKGIWTTTDIPFDAAKHLFKNISLKTTNQLVKADLTQFSARMDQAITIHTGKMAHQFTPDNLADTFQAAVKAFMDTPNLSDSSLVDLGRYLSEHVAMSDAKIHAWSRLHGGKLPMDIPAPIVSEVNTIMTDFMMKVGSHKANAKRMAQALEIDVTPQNIKELVKEIPAYTKSLATNIDTAIQIGKASRVNPVTNMMDYIMSRQKMVITANNTGKQASGKVLDGMMLGLMRKVDKLDNATWRRTLDRYMVKPFAEANLGSISYPIWNAFEGVAVSLVEGVTPKFVKWEAYNMMVKGLLGDASLARQSASDVVGVLGSSPNHPSGAYSLLPGKIPEKVFGINTPKFAAGKDWFEWFGRKELQISDVWSNALRRNFVTQKMAQHLAELAHTEAGGDVVKALGILAKGSPKISKSTLGISQSELDNLMFMRLLSGTDDVLALKPLLTNGSLMEGEVTKILRRAELMSPRARALAEQWKAGDILVNETEMVKFVDQIVTATVDDLKRYPYEIGESFRHTTATILDTPINTSDELLEIFTHYEVMSESAAHIPHRLMSQVMEETDVLYKTHKYGAARKLWETSRQNLLSTMTDVTSSMEAVKAKILSNSDKLTPKQRTAMEAVLERSTASNAIRDATLKADGSLLDDFWSLPKALRTPEEHAALRTYRAELWTNYRIESAIPSAGEFITRRSLSELYHDIPKSKLKPVNAADRPLTPQDIANVFSTNIDGLTTGLLDNIAMHGKEYFIQLVKQSADTNPKLFKGFTESKIATVYDNLIHQAGMNPEADILTQKILLQGEGMKQELLSLKMCHSITQDEEKALHAWIDNAAANRDAVIGDVDNWNALRQQALDTANKDYYKAFADYSNENIFNVMGKMIYPYWGYHNYRWFALSRYALKRPGLPIAWGKYQDYSEHGFIPSWFPDIEMNPFTGSMIGSTFTLTRFDFVSYYENLGYAGEILDYTQRWSYFPNAPLTALVSLTPLISGREPELGNILPPVARSGLNALTISDIPGIADAAKWLKDKVFHENFHEYYTATILDNKQVSAGGTLIDGKTGSDLWFMKLRGEKFSPEEQQLWDESYKEAAGIGILRSQFPQFRLKADEYKDAYKQVTKIFEELGMSEEYQKDLWRHHKRPTDVMGGLPLSTRAALDEIWEWKIYFGRGSILVAPEVSDLKSLMNKYWNKVESYQVDRLSTQADIDAGFITPTSDLHYTGREWRTEFATNWGDYASKTGKLEIDPEFVDAVEAFTPEGELALAKRQGFTVAPNTPLEEAINLYFDIELEKRADPYTGEVEEDFTTFWLKREAVRMALTEEQRDEFDTYIRRYQTPMELTFHHAYNTYIRGYKSVDRIVFDKLSEDEKLLVKEYYADTTILTRKEEIREIAGPTGKVMSQYETARSDARAALREVSPTLDFWLYVFGYTTKPSTTQARIMVDKWERDKSSILITRE